ncbi:MAG TPA: hypothetical protein VEL07_22455 [Planctomycetota bacterium]|nr:hypothetical protein [Planctomycetota bacterium]
MPERAFTLIEVMIASALGLTVCLTAFAGLRAAAQSVSLAERLATENALIRAGMNAAYHEVDAWRTYDDPADATRQRLRQYDATRRMGLPFTPLKTSWTPSGWSSADRTTWDEDDRGWNSGEAWSMDATNARTWWRGNHAERLRTDLRYGRYAIFSNLEPSLNVVSPAGDYGQVDVAHTWLPNQLAGLRDALGYYGMIDYMPANAIYGFYQAYSGAYPWTSWSSVSCEWVQPDYDWDWGTRRSYNGDTFSNNDGYTCHMRSLYSLNYASSYALYPPTAANAGWDVDLLVREHRCQKYTGYGSDRDRDMLPFIATAMTADALVPLKPTAWPQVKVSICRSIKIRRFNNLCKVTWTSPITGDTAELSFSGFGTTLRGARQDRGLDLP